MQYFRNKRQKIFPEIKDWTNPRDDYRYSNDIKRMDFKHWFYLTPSAYKLITFGINSLAIILFTILGVYALVNSLWILVFLCIVMDLSNGIALYRKIKQLPLTMDVTFYDIWMRDYNINLELDENK